MPEVLALFLGISIGLILIGFLLDAPIISVGGLVGVLVVILALGLGPKSKREICEENLPRNQKCVVQWVPESAVPKSAK